MNQLQVLPGDYGELKNEQRHVSLANARHGVQKDLRGILGPMAHDKLLLNSQMSMIPRIINSCNNNE